MVLSCFSLVIAFSAERKDAVRSQSSQRGAELNQTDKSLLLKLL